MTTKQMILNEFEIQNPLENITVPNEEFHVEGTIYKIQSKNQFITKWVPFEENEE